MRSASRIIRVVGIKHFVGINKRIVEAAEDPHRPDRDPPARGLRDTDGGASGGYKPPLDDSGSTR